LARFERSTLPEHNGTRTVLLRFLKIITPINCVIPQYDNYVRLPKEGELLQQKRDHVWGHWGVNIDEPVYKYRGKLIGLQRLKGLQLLWDA
jgi:hypothetical protein